jgi:hypothetical protein
VVIGTATSATAATAGASAVSGKETPTGMVVPVSPSNRGDTKADNGEPVE